MIPLTETPKLFNPDRPPSIKTIRSWVRLGVRGVKLETSLVGGRRFTTAESMQKFIRTINNQPVSAPTGNGHATQAEAELAAV